MQRTHRELTDYIGPKIPPRDEKNVTSFTRGGMGGHPPCRDHVTLSVTSRGTNSEGYKTRRSGVVLVRCFDGLVVKTSRCGREDPGSNPGRGSFFFFFFFFFSFSPYSVTSCCHWST